MFKYMYTYHPDTWEGYIKHGLIGKNSGVRICNSFRLTENLRFNQLAKNGSTLYNIIKDMNGPMYIDRLQGGDFYREYNYNMNLLNEYENMLGDNFYGLQMHEWVTNLLTDIARISDDTDCNWTKESILESLQKRFSFDTPYVEAFSVEEYAQIGKIDTVEKFYRVVKMLIEKRIKNYKLVTCDSHGLAYKLELEKGVKTFMPEVGAQTSDARFQISYARAMAKAYNARFGVYYETWGGTPLGNCRYERNGNDEWGIGQNSQTGPFSVDGENGGSSRSLHKRILYYSYLSGAEFISDEWGGGNMFYDWNTHELSPYGIINKEFMSFVNKYPDIGTKVAPIALVLPAKLDIVQGIRTQDLFCRYPLYGNQKKLHNFIKKTICDVFANATDMLGLELENETLVNSDITDCIDVIHEDSSTLLEYQYLIDATCNPTFAKTHNNICTVENLLSVIDSTLPCKIEGGLHAMINKAGEKYYLAIFNNSGVMRNLEEGEYIIPESKKLAKVMIKDRRTLKALEGAKIISCKDGVYNIEINGGDWFFGEF